MDKNYIPTYEELSHLINLYVTGNLATHELKREMRALNSEVELFESCPDHVPAFYTVWVRSTQEKHYIMTQ